MGIVFMALSMLPGQFVPVLEASEDTTALYQALLDLTNPITIMSVAAHPDDEDRDALAFYRMKYGARTVIVTATRGEGGQNSQGPELYEELGIVRVRELAAAARALDAITFNLAMPEFGFSKSSAETFKYWERREALRRLVYAIRFYQPDIIITQHDRKTGHGHHQATRLLAEEAFDLAADRYSFPEQLKERLDTWQPKRMFVRTFNREKYDTEFDVNEVAPVRKQQYARLAYESLQHHRTQGPWNAPDGKGELMVRYNLVKNKEGEFRRWYLFDQELARPAIYERIRALVFDGKATDPAQALALPRAELIARLVKALNETRAYLKGEGRGDRKVQELEEKLQRAITIAARLSLTVAGNTEKTAPGLDFTAKATITNGSALPVEVKDLRLGLPLEWDYKESAKIAASVAPAASATAEFAISLGVQAAPTLPASAHLYDIDFLEPQVEAAAKISIKDLSDPLVLRARTRVEVAPLVELELKPASLPVNIIDVGDTNTFPMQIKITNNQRMQLQGRLVIAQAPAVRITPEEPQFSVEGLSSNTLTFIVAIGRPVAEGALNLPITLIDNFGRPLLTEPLKLHLINVNVASDVRVGYVRSYDFTLPQTLQFLGVQNAELTAAEIAGGNLKQRFDTIVLDNRAYLAHPDLVKVNPKLIDFVREGGTLIVLYQRPADWNRATLSPYPIKLGDERVTDENAPVNILIPEHPVMVRPNRIAPGDFDNWVQERGLSFPVEWDERYKPLLSSADPDEAELKGGMLIGEHGRGHYIYTSYVIYRQLRAYNPGAFHIFANMISLPRTKL